MIYLVDYENVNLGGMIGIENLEEKDHVIVFLGNNTGAIPFEWHIRIMDSKAEVKYIKCGKVSKNYLDFQLATFCGYIMAGVEKEKIYVVSKDKGFDSIVDFWTENKEDVQIARIEAIDESLDIPRPMNKQKERGTKQRKQNNKKVNRKGRNRQEESAETFVAKVEPENVAEEPIRTEVELENVVEEAVKLEVEPENVVEEAVGLEVEPENVAEEPIKMEVENESEAEETVKLEVESEYVAEETAQPEETIEAESAIEESADSEEEAENAAEEAADSEIEVEKAAGSEAECVVGEAARLEAGNTAELGKKSGRPRKQKVQEIQPEKINKLADVTKKHIRQKIKDEQLNGGNYKTIYNIFMTQSAKNRFNTALVKAFQQEQGNRIYKKLLSEFEQHIASQETDN